MSILNRSYFRDEEAAYSFLEGILWKDGTRCPHCGVIGHAYRIKANPAMRVRYGLHKCAYCKKQFTVKISTVFENLRIPLHKALQGCYLLFASKKVLNSNQLRHSLGISFGAARSLDSRARRAKTADEVAPLVVDDASIVADKSNGRHRPAWKKKGRYHRELKVLSALVRNIVIDNAVL